MHSLHNIRMQRLSYNNTPCLKNVPPLICYNFDMGERILIFLAEILPIKYIKQSKNALLYRLK